MKKDKKLILAAAALAAVMAVMAAIYALNRPRAAQGAKSFEVVVVHSDGTARTFTYDTDAEYLGEALEAEGLIAGDMGQFGLYITTADGEDAAYEDNGAYWALYEGEEYAQQGISHTPIADGGSYSLVYTVG